MASWRNRPRNISHIDGGIPWIIAIDESGSPDLSYAQRVISSSATNYDEHNVHFNVTACLLSTDVFNEIADYFGVSTDYLLGRTDNPAIAGGGSEPDDIDKIIDRAMFFDGKPLTDDDRRALRGIISGYMNSKGD